MRAVAQGLVVKVSIQRIQRSDFFLLLTVSTMKIKTNCMNLEPAEQRVKSQKVGGLISAVSQCATGQTLNPMLIITLRLFKDKPKTGAGLRVKVFFFFSVRANRLLSVCERHPIVIKGRNKDTVRRIRVIKYTHRFYNDY